MKRIQIYIDEETYWNLKREIRLKGISISEIIRESVRKKEIEQQSGKDDQSDRQRKRPLEGQMVRC